MYFPINLNNKVVKINLKEEYRYFLINLVKRKETEKFFLFKQSFLRNFLIEIN